MRDRILVIVSFAFALGAGALYFGSLGDEPAAPPVAAATPRPAATPRARKPLKQPEFNPKAAPPSGLRQRDPRDPSPAEPPPFATIRGRVVLPTGYAADGTTVLAYIGGKRKVFKVESDGTFEFRQPGTNYRLRAERMDGAITTASDWVEIDATGGGEWKVDLVVPEETRGGLGIRIGRHADGIRVRAVLPNSPAAELGLRTNDIVLALGGEPVKGWTTGEFAKIMSGPLGTEQSFTVRRPDGSEEELVFERRFLER